MKLNNIAKKITFILLVILFFYVKTSSKPIYIFSSEEKYIPTIERGIYCDSTSKCDINEVKKKVFSVANLKNSFTKNLHAKYWYKFKIDTGAEPINNVYVQSFFRLNKFKIYILDSLENQVYESNELKLSSKTWQIFYHKQTIQLPIIPHSTYYIELEPIKNDVLSFSVFESTYFHNRVVREYMINGIFFGILSLLTIYNLILFFGGKEWYNIYYAIYILSFAIYAFVDWGLINFVLPFHYTMYYFYNIPYAIMNISILLFLMSILNLDQRNKQFGVAIKIMIFLRILIAVLANVQNVWVYENEIDTIFVWMCWVIAIYQQIRDRLRISRFMTFAFGVSVFCFTYATFKDNILVYIWDKNIFYLFNIIEAFIFAFAISLRYKHFKDIAEHSMLEQIEHYKISEELHIDETKKLNEIIASRNKELEQKNMELSEAIKTLRELNVNLNLQLKSTEEKLVFNKPIGYQEFIKSYPTDEVCLQYLVNLKWGAGFKCKRCGNTKYSPGNIHHSRRCNNCKYTESPTANTIFHHVKFPLTKAFYLIHLLYKSPNTKLDDIANEIDLRIATIHAFKNKVLEKLNNKKYQKIKVAGWEKFVLD